MATQVPPGGAGQPPGTTNPPGASTSGAADLPDFFRASVPPPPPAGDAVQPPPPPSAADGFAAAPPPPSPPPQVQPPQVFQQRPPIVMDALRYLSAPESDAAAAIESARQAASFFRMSGNRPLVDRRAVSDRINYLRAQIEAARILYRNIESLDSTARAKNTESPTKDDVRELAYEMERARMEVERLESAYNNVSDVFGAVLDVKLEGREAYILGSPRANIRNIYVALNTPDAGGETILSKLASKKAVLVILGDIIHPSSTPLDEMTTSAQMLDFIFGLTRMFPSQIILLRGRHDRTFGGFVSEPLLRDAGVDLVEFGGLHFDREGVRQGTLFRDYLINRRGAGYAQEVEMIMEELPLLARFRQGDARPVIAGASPIVGGSITLADIIAARFTRHLDVQLLRNNKFFDPGLQKIRALLHADNAVIVASRPAGGGPIGYPPDRLSRPFRGLVVLRADGDVPGLVRVGTDGEVREVLFKDGVMSDGFNLSDQMRAVPRVFPMTSEVFDENLRLLTNYGPVTPGSLRALHTFVGRDFATDLVDLYVTLDARDGKIIRMSTTQDPDSQLIFRRTQDGIITSIIVKQPGYAELMESMRGVANRFNTLHYSMLDRLYRTLGKQEPSLQPSIDRALSVARDAALHLPAMRTIVDLLPQDGAGRSLPPPTAGATSRPAVMPPPPPGGGARPAGMPPPPRRAGAASSPPAAASIPGPAPYPPPTPGGTPSPGPIPFPPRPASTSGNSPPPVRHSAEAVRVPTALRAVPFAPSGVPAAPAAVSPPPAPPPAPVAPPAAPAAAPSPGMSPLPAPPPAASPLPVAPPPAAAPSPPVRPPVPEPRDSLPPPPMVGDQAELPVVPLFDRVDRAERMLTEELVAGMEQARNSDQLYNEWCKARYVYFSLVAKISAHIANSLHSDPHGGATFVVTDVFGKVRGEVTSLAQRAVLLYDNVTRIMPDRISAVAKPRDESIITSQLHLLEPLHKNVLALKEMLLPTVADDLPDLQQRLTELQNTWAQLQVLAFWTHNLLAGMRSYYEWKMPDAGPIRRSNLNEMYTQIGGVTSTRYSTGASELPFETRQMFLGVVDTVLRTIQTLTMAHVKLQFEWDAPSHALVIVSPSRSLSEILDRSKMGDLIDKLGGEFDSPGFSERRRRRRALDPIPGAQRLYLARYAPAASADPHRASGGASHRRIDNMRRHDVSSRATARSRIPHHAARFRTRARGLTRA